MGTGRPAGRPSTKPKKKPGRPKKGDLPAVPENLQGAEDLGAGQTSKKGKGGRPAGASKDKSGLIKKKMEKFMLDMFGVYEDKDGKQAILDAIKNDAKFAEFMAKELFSIGKKYFDMKMTEMKITEGKTTEDIMGGYNGPQNVFIINGLQEVKPHVQDAINKAVNGERVIEAQFTVVGLDRD